MKIIGVDPGVKGAIAIYDVADRNVTCFDMPDTTTGLHDLVSFFPPVAGAMIEKPFYPKVIGVRNVARIAESYGKILSAFAWCGIPVREVRPADWKASLNLSSHKAASREMAGRFFPDDAHQWAQVKDDGRAEAALLAWFGVAAFKGANQTTIFVEGQE